MKPRHEFIVPYGPYRGEFITAIPTRALHWLARIASEQGDTMLKEIVHRENEFRLVHKLEEGVYDRKMV